MSAGGDASNQELVLVRMPEGLPLHELLQNETVTLSVPAGSADRQPVKILRRPYAVQVQNRRQMVSYDSDDRLTSRPSRPFQMGIYLMKVDGEEKPYRFINLPLDQNSDSQFDLAIQADVAPNFRTALATPSQQLRRELHPSFPGMTPGLVWYSGWDEKATVRNLNVLPPHGYASLDRGETFGNETVGRINLVSTPFSLPDLEQPEMRHEKAVLQKIVENNQPPVTTLPQQK